MKSIGPIIENTESFLISEIFNQKEGNEINTFLNQYNAFELQNSISKTKVSVSLSKHGIINIRSVSYTHLTLPTIYSV